MDLSGLQKLKGADIRRHNARRPINASKFTAELRPVGAIDPTLVVAWRDLVAEASEPNCFYEPWFLEPALRHFDTHPDLCLFLLWAGRPDHSELLALFPLGPVAQYSRWPVAHVQNWVHHNSFLGTPLVRVGHEMLFWQALGAKLDESNWPGFLHINGLTIGGELDRAMRKLCAKQNRRCDLVHSEARAFLQSDLDPDAYYRATVRSKKRKELRRQAKRLGELGEVKFAQHQDAADLDQWITEFLQLEKAGWKGESGSALDCDISTRAFFRDAVIGAAKAGQLERRDVRLDGKPLAMLVNFLSAPGSFSFKTAFAEEYSKYSPGVLLQFENLYILKNPSIDWMDSCAAEDHPMIDSLWSGRRHIGRFSIELSGLSRKSKFRAVRLGEDLMARLKGREIVDITRAVK